MTKRRGGVLLRGLGAVLGGGIFLMFLAPLFGGILDLSNFTGMAGGLLILWVCLRWERCKALVRRIWSRRWGRLLLSAVGLLTLAVLILLFVLCCRVMSRMREQPETDAGTLIVLGCQVRGQTPSLLLYYRIQAAGDYLDAHPEAVAILSGSQGTGEDISEAECMYRALTARGIAPERLYLEDRSHITLENLTFSREIIRREGLSQDVVVVSNDFHIYRALRMAEDLDFPVQGLAAPSAWYSKPTNIFREAMALVKYWLTA